MEMKHRRTVIIVTAVAIGMLTSLSAFATPDTPTEYPTKPVTVVVTFPAGGLADVEARLLAKAYEDELGVPFQVVNRPGGGFIPGVTSVLEEPADGYTILHMLVPNLVTTPYMINAPYTYKDFVPLFFEQSQKNVIYVPVDSEFKTLADFVEAGKTRTLIVGVNAIGAPPHLTMEQFAQSVGISVEYLVGGTIPASIVASIGGHSDAAIGQLLQQAQYPDEIRPLGILDTTGSDILPGVPTVSEALPGMGAKAVSWVRGGFAVEAGTPQYIIDILADTAEKVVHTQAMKDAFTKAALVYDYTGYDGAQAAVDEAIAFYWPMIDALGLKQQQ